MQDHGLLHHVGGSGLGDAGFVEFVGVFGGTFQTRRKSAFYGEMLNEYKADASVCIFFLFDKLQNNIIFD